MTFLSKIQNINASEISTFIKENSQNEEFLSEVKNNKELFINLLLSQKVYPAAIMNSLVENSNDTVVFLKSCIEHNFTPSVETIEILSLEAGYEQVITDVLTTFPTIPVSVQMIIRFINRDLEENVVKVLQVYPTLRKPEVYSLMLLRGFSSLEFVEMYFSEDQNCKIYVQAVNHTFSNISELMYPSSFSNYFILNKYDEDLKFKYLLNAPNYLNEAAFDKCLNEFISELTPESKATGHNLIAWHDTLENLPEKKLHGINFLSVPETSKYRSNHIKKYPFQSTNEELVGLISEKRGYKAAIVRGMEFIKLLDLKHLQEIISPSKLVEILAGNDEDSEKAKFFYKNLPSKYSSYLYKILPLDAVPEKKATKKRSYYVELFEALKQKNLTSFRENLENGYSVEQFAEDSKQSSKSRNCELMSSLDWGLYAQLTKEELVALCKTPIRFSSPPSDHSLLDFKVNADESYQLLKKFSPSFVFGNVENKLDFIQNGGMDEDQVTDLFKNNYRSIVEDPSLLKEFLKQSKENDYKLKLDGRSCNTLSEHLTHSELKKLVAVDYDNFEDFLNIKSIDGQDFVSFEDIVDFLKERRVNIENEDVLKALSRRNPEYYQNVIKAYLGGNKEMSEFFEEKINIKRMKKDLFERLSKESLVDVESEVERIFNEGGQLENFSGAFFDWETVLQKHGKSRNVHTAAALPEELPKYAKIAGVNFVIDNLVVGHEQSSLDDIHFLLSKELSNISINHLIIESQACNEEFLSKTLPVIKNKMPELIVKFSDVLSARGKLNAILCGVTQFGSEPVAREMIENGNLHELNIDELMFLEGYGIVFNEEFIVSLINNNVENIPMMKWLQSRVGDFENIAFNEEMLNNTPAKIIKELKSLGLNFMDEQSLWMFNTKKTLLRQGKDFSAIIVSELSFEDLTGLVKFITENVDPEYKKLDLETTNLVELDVLAPYHIMSQALSYKDEDLIRTFLVPKNYKIRKF